MKLRKVLALGLVTAMMASMAIGVSASSTTVIRDAASGDATPASGSADVAIEGIIEPTAMTNTDDELLPTDPSKTSDASSGWDDPVVDNTSQLLVSAPTVMKFVVRGEGTALGTANLVGAETVSGTIKNASAYIPANNGTVRPKEVEVGVSAINLEGTKEFNLLAKDATAAEMEDFTSAVGSVQGLGLQLGSNTLVDFAAPGSTLGTLAKGSLTTENSVAPSAATIKFVADGMKTAFKDGHTGRLVNNYNMGLTFTYKK